MKLMYSKVGTSEASYDCSDTTLQHNMIPTLQVSPKEHVVMMSCHSVSHPCTHCTASHQTYNTHTSIYCIAGIFCRGITFVLKTFRMQISDETFP